VVARRCCNLVSLAKEVKLTASYRWLVPGLVIYDSVTWWNEVLQGDRVLELTDFTQGEPWGGTPHLENLDSGHAKYLERLEGWANSSAYPKWSDYDYETARLYALYAFPQSGGDATPYWSMIAKWWAEEAPSQLSSLSEEQFSKIVASLAVSEDAAKTYADNRKLGIPTPKPGDFPWWMWAAGGFGLWILIRK